MNFLVVVIAMTLIFDFINGFHDSVNSIAVVLSTRALSPFYAIAMAAIFNLLAFLIFPLKVASTMGKGVIDPSIVTLPVIFAAVSAAIIRNLITW
ncbi:MAG TPA: inorganic phosphate transporter [Bacteroidales bacterium]|nr:inorganic phosphate transporter [Bacteroidales bacterium]